MALFHRHIVTDDLDVATDLLKEGIAVTNSLSMIIQQDKRGFLHILLTEIENRTTKIIVDLPQNLL